MAGAFLEDLERFRGTGAKNKDGLTLEDFLAAYDVKAYDCPSNTVDMLVFRSEGPFRKATDPLQLLLIRRGDHPSIGMWALPGGFVEIRENLEDAARRELQEETGIRDLPLVQLSTWGEYDRDPRWRVITTSYLALVEGPLPVRAGDDAADAAWFDLSFEQEAGENGGCAASYALSLRNDERGIRLRARVERRERRQGILTSHHYTLLSTEGIAADHGILITDALLYLYGRLA